MAFDGGIGCVVFYFDLGVCGADGCDNAACGQDVFNCLFCHLI